MIKKLMLLMSMVLLMPAIALAVPTTIGDPIEGNSWSQQFNESGVGNFNIMEIYMLSDDYFEQNAFSGFTDTSWVEVNTKYDSESKTTFAQATGDLVTSLNFYINFIGDRSNSLEFDFVAWNNNTLLEAANAIWDGSSWTITASQNAYQAPVTAPVPEPSTILLVGTGLIGIIGFGRKRLNKKA